MISKSGETETFRLVLQKSAPYFFTLVCYINKIVFNHYEIVTICIYCSLSAGLYACEIWKGTTRIARKLHVFHLNSLRIILNILWKYKLFNTTILSIARNEALFPDSCWLPIYLPYSTFSWKPTSTFDFQLGTKNGKQPRGPPRKTWCSNLAYTNC